MKKVQSNQVVSVESSEKDVMSAFFATHDAYITATPAHRTAEKDSYFKVLRDLSQVRLAKGMQFLRVKDEELIQDKLNLISDIHTISNDEFNASNLCPILNRTRVEPEISNDIKELEAVSRLIQLFEG